MTIQVWNLTSTEFAVLWERSGRDRLPFPLTWFATPGTADDAERERADAARTLDAVLDTPLLEALATLVDPPVRMHAVSVGSATTRLHGGVGPVSAVIAHQAPSGAVRITTCSRSALPAQIAELVVGTAGSALAMHAPASTLAGPDRSVTTSSTAPVADRVRIADLEARERTGGGELLIGHSDNYDALIRRPQGGCRWIDVADDGRYLLTASGDVDPVLHVEPATTSALVGAVRALLDASDPQAPTAASIGVGPATNS